MGPHLLQAPAVHMVVLFTLLAFVDYVMDGIHHHISNLGKPEGREAVTVLTHTIEAFAALTTYVILTVCRGAKFGPKVSRWGLFAFLVLRTVLLPCNHSVATNVRVDEPHHVYSFDIGLLPALAAVFLCTGCSLTVLLFLGVALTLVTCSIGFLYFNRLPSVEVGHNYCVLALTLVIGLILFYKVFVRASIMLYADVAPYEIMCFLPYLHEAEFAAVCTMQTPEFMTIAKRRAEKLGEELNVSDIPTAQTTPELLTATVKSFGRFQDTRALGCVRLYREENALGTARANKDWRILWGVCHCEQHRISPLYDREEESDYEESVIEGGPGALSFYRPIVFEDTGAFDGFKSASRQSCLHEPFPEEEIEGSGEKNHENSDYEFQSYKRKASGSSSQSGEISRADSRGTKTDRHLRRPGKDLRDYWRDKFQIEIRTWLRSWILSREPLGAQKIEEEAQAAALECSDKIANMTGAVHSRVCIRPEAMEPKFATTPSTCDNEMTTPPLKLGVKSCYVNDEGVGPRRSTNHLSGTRPLGPTSPPSSTGITLFTDPHQQHSLFAAYLDARARFTKESEARLLMEEKGFSRPLFRASRFRSLQSSDSSRTSPADCSEHGGSPSSDILGTIVNSAQNATRDHALSCVDETSASQPRRSTPSASRDRVPTSSPLHVIKNLASLKYNGFPATQTPGETELSLQRITSTIRPKVKIRPPLRSPSESDSDSDLTHGGLHSQTGGCCIWLKSLTSCCLPVATFISNVVKSTVSFISHSSFVIQCASWVGRPIVPRQYSLTCRFRNNRFERWYLDWFKGYAQALYPTTFVLQCLGFFINLVCLCGLQVWRSSHRYKSDLVPYPKGVWLFSLIDLEFLVGMIVFFFIEAILLLLLFRKRKTIHTVHTANLVTILLGLGRVLSTATYMRFRLQEGIEDQLILFAPLIINIMLFPIASELSFDICLFFLFAMWAASAALFHTSNAPLDTAAVSLHAAFFHCFISFYLVFVGSSERYRRRLFSIWVLPYLIDLHGLVENKSQISNNQVGFRTLEHREPEESCHVSALKCVRPLFKTKGWD